jgi:hypothetical protein
MYIVDKIVYEYITYITYIHTHKHTYIHIYGLFHYALRGAQVPKIRTEGLVEHLVLHSPNPGTAGMYLYIFYVCMCVCTVCIINVCIYIYPVYTCTYSIVQSSIV